MRPIRRNPDRGEAHRPVADPADSLLLALGDTLDDVERTRISNENRLRSLVGEHEFSGKGVPDTDLAAVRLGEVVDALGEIERSVVRDLEKAMKAHPLGLCVKRQRGLGLKQVARLLAAIGDPLMNEAEGVPGAARPSCGPTAATLQASGASADARRYRASAHKQPRGGSDISDHTPKPSGSSRYSSRSGLTTEAVGADHCTAAVIASGRRRESQWRSTVTEWLTEARSSGPRRPGTRSPGARMSLDRASRSLLS
jgi:hypothetical protein